MLNYYQPYLLPFLGFKTHKLPHNVKRFYYHSMEDALWEFIREKTIQKGSTFLLPDFYCVDVLNNIHNHGYKYKLYKVDRNFNAETDAFIEYIEMYKPRIVFIFHSAGITSNLLQNSRWLSNLPSNCFIIEDCVHRLVNPSTVSFIHKNHVVMDSIRKVSPLPGSFVYSSPQLLSYKQSTFRPSKYFFKSALLFMIFRVYFMAGCMLNSAAITDFAHQKILQMHDDIIGDNWESYPGLPWIPFIHSFFNFEKIEKLKIKQVSLYKKLMQNIYSYKNKKNIFYEIQIPTADYKNLHVYPVGITVSENKTKDLIEFLHTHNASVWIKFPGCEWNKDKSCLFLPLGFHISENDIRYVVRLLQQFISNPQ